MNLFIVQTLSALKVSSFYNLFCFIAHIGVLLKFLRFSIKFYPRPWEYIVWYTYIIRDAGHIHGESETLLHSFGEDLKKPRDKFTQTFRKYEFQLDCFLLLCFRDVQLNLKGNFVWARHGGDGG